MIYKYTKCESVIAKIMADLNITEKNQRVTDIREWIFEAVEKIGAPMQYIQKQGGTKECPILEVQDYQVPIPKDLVTLDGVAFSLAPTGPWVPVRTTTNMMHQPNAPYEPTIVHSKPELAIDPNNLAIEQEQPNIEPPKEPEEHQPMQYKIPTSQSQFYTINGTKYLNKLMLDGRGKEPTYMIKPGWIVMNQKHGYCKLMYKAIATDQRGYPLIPDLTSYQEAIYWYVTMKLNFPKFLNGGLGGKSRYSGNVYFYLQQQWNFYRNQAYAEAMMPTQDDMRTIKNEWNKLIPEWDADDTFFDAMGSKQSNFNDYYYGY